MKDIYGCVSDCNSAEGCTPNAIKALLPKYISKIKKRFHDVTTTIRLVLDTLIMTTVKNVGFMGEMTGRSSANIVIIVYMIWSRMNPGTTFDVDSSYQRNQIKDIYLNMGADWRSDPVIGNAKTVSTKKSKTSTIMAAPINTTPL